MVSPKKVPAGLGKSQQDAVGLQSLLDQSEARTGDNAPMAFIQLLDQEKKIEEKKSK